LLLCHKKAGCKGGNRKEESRRHRTSAVETGVGAMKEREVLSISLQTLSCSLLVKFSEIAIWGWEKGRKNSSAIGGKGAYHSTLHNISLKGKRKKKEGTEGK